MSAVTFRKWFGSHGDAMAAQEMPIEAVDAPLGEHSLRRLE